MADRITIESRKSTTEPLVEIELTSDGRDGPFVPAGRRFWEGANATGRNSYGLTDTEDVAFQNACDRLRGLPDQHYTDRELVAALVGAGISVASPFEQRTAFVIQYRTEHPLPTSFASLAFGDPCNNFAQVIIPIETTQGTAPAPVVAAPVVAAPIAHVDELHAAPPAVSTEATTHVMVPNTHIDFLHALLAAVEPAAENAAQQLAVMAFQAAFKKVFPRAAAA